jgi:hypothetical protein
MHDQIIVSNAGGPTQSPHGPDSEPGASLSSEDGVGEHEYRRPKLTDDLH